MKTPYFITGIGTGIGKTLVSAVLTEKLEADYWKPIQSGDLEESDTIKVRNLISNKKTCFHEERYRLSAPLSPHLSARLDHIDINLQDFVLPKTENQLLIEGAGGLMVPLNDRALIIDLIAYLKAEVILVSQHYLGSINHTLLSIELLKARGIAIKGIIFNGENAESERYIIQYSKVRKLGTLPVLETIDKEHIKKATSSIAEFLSP